MSRNKYGGHADCKTDTCKYLGVRNCSVSSCRRRGSKCKGYTVSCAKMDGEDGESDGTKS